MNNLVSVIIVNFNAGNYLLDCVRSILANDIPLEIFVSDNNSTDNSIALLQQVFPSEPRLTIQKNNTNLGFSRGNNAVLAKTQGEFILFLNPDCVLQKNTLQQMQSVMANYPQAGMAGCLIYNPDGSVQTTSVRAIPTPWNTLVRVLHLNKLFPHTKMFRGIDLGDHIPTTTTCVAGISGAFMWVRRAALEQVGSLDDNYFLYCEDVDWMMRFQQNHWQILFVPEVSIVHAKSISSQQTPFAVLWYKHRGMVRFYRKFFRTRYSFVLMYLVYLAIGLRFSLLTLLTLMKKMGNLTWLKFN